jgi:hypothetical protein
VRLSLMLKASRLSMSRVETRKYTEHVKRHAKIARLHCRGRLKFVGFIFPGRNSISPPVRCHGRERCEAGAENQGSRRLSLWVRDSSSSVSARYCIGRETKKRSHRRSGRSDLRVLANLRLKASWIIDSVGPPRPAPALEPAPP